MTFFILKLPSKITGYGPRWSTIANFTVSLLLFFIIFVMPESEFEDCGSSGFKISSFIGRLVDYYGHWCLLLRAVCRVKGVWGVLEPSTGASSTTTAITSAAEGALPSNHELTKRERESGTIISSLGDSPIHVVLEADDDPKRILKLLDACSASNRTVSSIAVQTQLYCMRYTDQVMSTYVDKYTFLFSQPDQMGKDANIPETHKAPMILASIDPECPF